jgi:hypothetical protein
MLGSAVSIAAGPAHAMPFAARLSGAAAAANAVPIVRVMNVCGVGGCAPVFTKRVEQPPAGFVRRAVPLTVPKTTTVQPVNAAK